MLKTIKIIALCGFIFIVLCVVGYFVVLRIAFSSYHYEPLSSGTDLITTSLGDEFLLQYETNNFPDIQTDIDIIDNMTSAKVAHFISDAIYMKPKITVLINTPYIRCYEFDRGMLIYKVDNGQFRGSYIDFIKNEKVEGSEDLVEASRALVAKKEWRWVKACGSFLLKAGDHDMRELLERYASGQFTQEELELNKNSEIKKEDIMAFSKQMLEQNNKPE